MNRIPVDKNICIMRKGDRAVYKSVDISLFCKSGILWITWPGSDDVILKENQKINVAAAGKVCIESFAESSLEIISVKELNFIKYRFRNFYRSGISYFKNKTGENLVRNGIVSTIR